MITHKPKSSRERSEKEYFERITQEIDDFGLVPISKIFTNIDEADPVLYYAYFEN
jgi:hypothetical protein